jgi:tRNA nucleotidyltransferase/poly(A) polymerase
MITGADHAAREYLEKIKGLLAGQPDVYLVGGSIRDLLLQRPIHDMDLVLAGDVRMVARRIARAVDGAFYMLDQERNTARVIDRHAHGGPVVLDFAHYRANDLESDLWARDFTINAMALELNEGGQLIDPTGGAADARAGILRACTPAALESDPVRVLRGVRLAVTLGFRIEPETFQLIRSAVPLLGRVTAERKRDELFRMLEGIKTTTSLRILDMIGALEHLLPELTATKGVTQSAPHTLPVYEHTLLMIDMLDQLLDTLVGEYKQEAGASLMLGIASVRLGRYRMQLAEHFKRAPNPNRSLRGLLMLGTLYHDAGKAVNRTVDEDGRIRFFGHEKSSEEMIALRGKALVLSQAEVQRIKTVIANHMRIHHLTSNEKLPSRRAVYRFFRSTGEAGIDVCLLSLADIMATYGTALPVEVWNREVDICRILLESWWEKGSEVISPPKLISGADIVKAFHLKPGPMIGRLLEAVHEAQAMGDVTNRQEALDYALRWLQRKHPAALQGENEKDG